MRKEGRKKKKDRRDATADGGQGELSEVAGASRVGAGVQRVRHGVGTEGGAVLQPDNLSLRT